MKYVWMVAMGIGENVSANKPSRIFSNKKDAYTWVEKMFKVQIERLHTHLNINYAQYEDGVTIGNSFAVTKIEVEEGDDEKH